ncbi:tetratricopeptide repeat protein [Alloalcanivorax gelatiniphagus]|uniref:tetratricopeptide repeat protein n=1 Tax=Alloalcanivorax gelatiniphagus TaxID=1194167 RepID=UPI003615B6A9
MTVFVILPLVLVLAVLVGFLLWRRESRRAGAPVTWSGLALPLLVAGLAGLGYLTLGLHPETLDWLSEQRRYDAVAERVIRGEGPSDEDHDISAQALTRVLQAKVVRDPTLPGWYTLGLLYDQLGAPAQAQEAARRALALDPRDDGARLLLARGLIAQNQGRLNDAADAQIRQVLADNPTHDGALMLRAMAATEARRFELAADSWRALLVRHGDGEAGNLIRQGLARAEAQQQRGARLQNLTFTVRAPDLPDGGTLFVFLRQEGGSGQPLAARRVLEDSFPVTVTLGADDWLRNYPERIDTLRVAARYTPAPGSSVEQAHLGSAPQSLDPDAQPAAIIELGR